MWQKILKNFWTKQGLKKKFPAVYKAKEAEHWATDKENISDDVNRRLIIKWLGEQRLD
jgi:hypothetical protein